MKKPERSCIICKRTLEKKELVRIVKSPEDEISLDLTGRKNGRGAYLCYDPSCLEKLKQGRGLDRAFKKQVPFEIYESIVRELEALREGKNG